MTAQLPKCILGKEVTDIRTYVSKVDYITGYHCSLSSRVGHSVLRKSLTVRAPYSMNEYTASFHSFFFLSASRVDWL